MEEMGSKDTSFGNGGNNRLTEAQDPSLVTSPIDSPINSLGVGAGAGADILSEPILPATTISSTPTGLPLNLPIPLPELVSTRQLLLARAAKDQKSPIQT
ncbi:hypothetical protein LWI29_009981 [Acer saccharum]|uniref:Uncharacterized protein n=1 Tax=Acer saccharum TaxID=4024 RepID=A0AA39VB19_ACESA|nr:hypothetical protein LWI29_009981 [Acer saccharum]